MTDLRPEPTDPSGPPPSRVHDRRVAPRGVLPRQLQTWLMVGIAAVMLLIILLTGRHVAPTQPLSSDRSAAPTIAPADRIRSFQQQLADEETRRKSADQLNPPSVAPGSSETPAGPPQASGFEDAARRAEASLFADNVAFSRRTGMPSSPVPAGVSVSGLRPPDPVQPAALDPWLTALTAAASGRQGGGTPELPSPVPESVAQPPQKTGPAPPSAPKAEKSGPTVRLLEGTVIEAVLLNRLDGTFAGPVSAMVTSAVYSSDRQHVVIPAGTRVLGSAAPVQGWGDARLAIRFHRLAMPDGRVHSLDQFTGLNQIGETGLRDQVNRHYWQVFGASLAVGALSGLAQLGTRSGIDRSFVDASRQGAGAGLAESTARILDRYLNVLPTVTIREGYRLKVYLTSDLDLPVSSATIGGVR